MTGKVVWTRATCVIFLLASTALLLGSRDGREIVVPHTSLQEFPLTLGQEWNGRQVPIDPAAIEILGAGDFAERLYQRSGDAAPVDLFLGYFPTQRTGVSIHSPKNCLPGSGWAPLESKYISLSVADGRTYSVNQYVIQKGEQKQLVLYWYQAHGRLVASEYVAKFYLVSDSMRLNRSDAALVRVITPLLGSEDVSSAQNRALQFAKILVPRLQPYIPE